MIDEINFSHNRGMSATCIRCSKPLKKLELRGVQIGKQCDGYVCEKCLKDELKDAPSKISNMQKQFETLSKLNEEERLKYLERARILKKL